MIRLLFTLIFALILAFPIFAQEPVKAKGRKVAFLVGVNNYAGSGFRCLKQSEQEINTLGSVLKSAGYSIVQIMSESEVAHQQQLHLRPTARNIASELEKFAKTLNEDDTLLFVYAGHSGIIKKDRAAGLQLFPSDVRVNREDSMLPLTKIYEILGEKCKAKEKVFFFAPCRNDATDDDVIAFRLSQEECPELPPPPKSVFVVSACKAGEKSDLRTDFFTSLASCLFGEYTSEKMAITGRMLLKHLKPLYYVAEKNQFFKGDIDTFEKIDFSRAVTIKSNWEWSDYACRDRRVIFENNMPKWALIETELSKRTSRFAVVEAFSSKHLVTDVAAGWMTRQAGFNQNGSQVVVALDDIPYAGVIDSQRGAIIDYVKHPTGYSPYSNGINKYSYSSNDKLLLTCDRFGIAILTSIETKKELFAFRHKSPLRDACFLHGDEMFVTLTYDHVMTAWSTSTRRKLWETTLPHPARCMTLSPVANHLALGCDDSTLLIYNAVTGANLLEEKVRLSRIYYLSYSPKGNQLVLTGSDYLSVIFDLEQKRSTHEFWHRWHVGQPVFSPDGFMVATTCNLDGVKLWDSETGRCKRHWKEARGMKHLAFSPDNKKLVGLSEIYGVHIWDIETGKRLDSGNKPD